MPKTPKGRSATGSASRSRSLKAKQGDVPARHPASQFALHAAQTHRATKQKHNHNVETCKCNSCLLRRGGPEAEALRAKLAEQLAPYKLKAGDERAAEIGSIGGTVTAENTKAVVRISDAVLEILEQGEDALGEKLPQLGRSGKRTVAQAIAHALARTATGLISVDGFKTTEKVSVEAARELREITEGKIPNKNEHTGKDGQPLNLAPVVLHIHFIEADNGKPKQ